MAEGHQTDTSWMWHPSFTESRPDTAGHFVHFRRTVSIREVLPSSFKLEVTADTRYKLFVNQELASFGPVKGDANLWFYDEIDIASYLRLGENCIHVVVLRFFYATPYATSFPRLPSGGLRVTTSDPSSAWYEQIKSSAMWETTIDETTLLRINEPEDDFLHIYEHTKRLPGPGEVNWIPAQILSYQTSTGNSVPWKLSPRLIPYMRRQNENIFALHNVHSDIPLTHWQQLLLRRRETGKQEAEIRLAANTIHTFDLEMPHHITSFVRISFGCQPMSTGGRMRVRYAESYEDKPKLVPYLRQKGDRRDSRKGLYGPEDIYEFCTTQWKLMCDKSIFRDVEDADYENEVFAPFHFRTFRFMRVSINVGNQDMLFKDIDFVSVQYPLEVIARVQVPAQDSLAEKLWQTSVRTLNNCMHDCYEDCPFYEQLQYAMDTRSSALFTYYTSADYLMARQAIIQLHSSFSAHIGLTCSRAPSHKPQIIPHFSLFWICMLDDHFTFFGDKDFIVRFFPVADAILYYFESRIDTQLGLVVSDCGPGVWNYTDWAEAWRPYGVPPSVAKTRVSTYTNNLYAYTLRVAAHLLSATGSQTVAAAYIARARKVTQCINIHCFDGQFYSDSLVNAVTNSSIDYSQHNQVWSVLSGAADPKLGQKILNSCLDTNAITAVNNSIKFVPISTSMSFYTLRALSQVGGNLYDEHFHRFWAPWSTQLALNVTTWEEDSVSQRSDCHAWSCAPLYEYMAEVVGIRPSEPGWASIIFQPRLALYGTLNATVPLRRSGSKVDSLVHVSWHSSPNGSIKVQLKLETSDSVTIPVHVILPSRKRETFCDFTKLEFIL